MKKIMVFSVFAFIFVCGAASAATDTFAVELHTIQSVIKPNDPIHVQVMVNNMGENALPLFIQRDAHLTQPRVTYRLSLTSLSDGNVDASTYGPLVPGFNEVQPHSQRSLWTINIKRTLAILLPSQLSPGLYRVSIDGTWEGVTSYWAEAYFSIVPDSDDEAVLDAIAGVNTNVASTQAAVQDVKSLVVTGNQDLESHLTRQDASLNNIYSYVRKVYTYAYNTYNYAVKIFNLLMQVYNLLIQP